MKEKHNRKPYLFGLAILIFLVGFRWPWPGGIKTWEDVDTFISENYPQVKHISTEELYTLFSNGRTFSLFDIRTPEEFAVSHLHGAVRADKAGEVELPRETFIVAYCSVGVRSAAFVRDLQQQGYLQAFNLKGSLFEWANKGFVLEQDGKSTYKAHPYNAKWGLFLDKKLHSD